MSTTRKILAFVLAFALTLTLLTVALAEAGEVVGGRHNGMTWSYDPSTKTLTINGSGELPADHPMPWQEFEEEIEIVIFRYGIEAIPADFLKGCVNVKQIFIPASVTSIGAGVLTAPKTFPDVIYEGDLDALLATLQSEQDREIVGSMGDKVKKGNIVDDVIVIDENDVYNNPDKTMKSITTVVEDNVEKTNVEYKSGVKLTIYKYLKDGKTTFVLDYPSNHESGLSSVTIEAQDLWDELDKSEDEVNKMDEDEKVIKGEVSRSKIFADGSMDSILSYYKNKKVAYSVSYSYDNSGNMTFETLKKYNKKGEKTSSDEVTYNNDGTMEEQQTTYWGNENTNMKSDKLLIYDDEGVLESSSEEFYDKGGAETSSVETKYTYDGGMLSETEETSKVDDEVQRQKTTVYDDKGREESTSEIIYKDNEEDEQVNTTYEYDDDDKLSSTTATSTNDKGRETVTETLYNEDESIDKVTKTIKDSGGDREIITDYENGEMTERRKYRYTESGEKVIEETVKFKDGEVVERIPASSDDSATEEPTEEEKTEDTGDK